MNDAPAAAAVSTGEPVRVMLLLSSLNGGGAERVAINLVARCDPAAVHLTIALLRRAGPYLDQVDPAKVVASPGDQAWLAFDQHNSAFYRPDRLLAGALQAPRNIAAMIRQVRPHVLMSFSKGMNILAWSVLGHLGADRPIWICREDNNTDAVIDDELANPLGRAFVKRLTRHVYRKADCFFAVAYDLADTLQAQLGLDPGKMRVIHNPIDLPLIAERAAQPLADPPTRPFIVSAGRLVPQKGYDLLASAFAASPAARELDLVILGMGEQEAALKAQAAALGVGDRVKFPGFQANPWAWFAKARLFVLASRWEGFGNVVSEALACGAPSLVSDCDFGPREQVEHGVSGWVFKSGDAADLTAAFDTLLSQPALLDRFAAAGRERAKAFDLDAIAKQYTALFLEQASLPFMGRNRPRSGQGGAVRR